MKKIISFLLLICCIVTVCSCDMVDGVKDKVNQITGKATVADFEAAIANTNASSVVIETVSKTALGDLKSKFEVYFKADGSATVKCSYEKFNLIGEGDPEDIKSTVLTTVYRNADGSYSEDIGVDLSSVTAAAALNLSAVKDAAVINEAGDVLSVTIPATKTAEVLGVNFAYDVDLEISIRNGVISFMKLNYTGGSATYQYAQ